MSLDIYFYQSEKCPNCGHEVKTGEVVYDRNITHNLSGMAKAAGFGNQLWGYEPVENAGELGELIDKGIIELKSNPEKYKPFSASNGWGTYEQFIPWLEEVSIACKEYPEAKVSCSR